MSFTWFGMFSVNLSPMPANKDRIKHLLDACFSELKDYQQATVEVIDRRFFVEKKRRHLLADEVGLGKTIVAKGVIAKAIERHIKSRHRNKPFKVVYICSNQALTNQNLTRLNIFKDKSAIDTKKGRLVFYAFKQANHNSLFQISSLTPSTSFRLKKGTGVREERNLLYLLMSKNRTFQGEGIAAGLKLVLLGNIETKYAEKWMGELEEHRGTKAKLLRPRIVSAFNKRIDKQTIDLNVHYYSPIRKELSLSGEVRLKTILLAYAKRLNLENVKSFEGPKRLLGLLRELLTDECLGFLEADLFILDEFQRFKDLIETNKEKQSEAAQIAGKVFSHDRAKVLMLSATPFKPYTTASDARFDEDHYKELEKVMAFLFDKDKKRMDEFRKNRKAFFSLLRRPEGICDTQIREKTNLEKLYREVISRTERLIVSDDRNTLLKGQTHKIEPIKEDALGFVATDRIVSKLGELTGKKGATIVDFCKSAPYPLSFMDKYKVKEELKNNFQSSHELQKAVKDNELAWIKMDSVQHYKPLGNIPNGNMRLLIEQALIKNDMWRQLWIAPCLPYYELKDSFKNAKNSTKVLVFSKWRMVPRAVAGLISYESERLSIGSDALPIDGEKLYTPKFYDNNPKKRQPRKPGKILALKLKEEKPQTMTAFSLLFPSLTLANCYDLKSNLKKQQPDSLDTIKAELKAQIKNLIQEANLAELKKKNQKTVNWYWVAPLLLDKHNYNKTYTDWILKGKYKKSKLYLNVRKHEDLGLSHQASYTEESAMPGDGMPEQDIIGNITIKKHFQELNKAFSNPNELELSEFPDDLLEVLAFQVLASPAVASLRMLSAYFGSKNMVGLLTHSLDIASEFHALFDKPESIAVIKIASLERDNTAFDETYWKDVLEYCTNGNLQAVFDEFASLLIADYKDPTSFTERMLASINMRTSNIYVNDGASLQEGKSYSLRCHYAVDFGTQNIEVEGGLNRIKSVLANFNSPFRPFVLASTSIGQEGLDFHYYCRKVMHWNLPTNPIDLEQREGRVNRYKGLVIRQNIAKKYAKYLSEANGFFWDYLFDLAEKKEGKEKNKPQLVPYWHVEPDDIYIERIAPLILFSRENKQYENIITTLALYRFTFGQPRQEELVEALCREFSKEEIERLREILLINLSPIQYLATEAQEPPRAKNMLVYLKNMIRAMR